MTVRALLCAQARSLFGYALNEVVFFEEKKAALFLRWIPTAVGYGASPGIGARGSSFPACKGENGGDETRAVFFEMRVHFVGGGIPFQYGSGGNDERGAGFHS